MATRITNRKIGRRKIKKEEEREEKESKGRVR